MPLNPVNSSSSEARILIFWEGGPAVSINRSELSSLTDGSSDDTKLGVPTGDIMTTLWDLIKIDNSGYVLSEKVRWT
ncbi:unnamed protein product [Macrosiphum euphorbiae]|uniref:Uncharacterized protein n=1 Tax=Macrosiphum euphorbiae TaxID=13131 RepID=A0AAV0WAG4_9HEMI|nr:unnamed protein product [Macrosiphum euphorbiae]